MEVVKLYVDHGTFRQDDPIHGDLVCYFPFDEWDWAVQPHRLFNAHRQIIQLCDILPGTAIDDQHVTLQAMFR